ncbi:hypothetical protein E2C01_025191 [Portunus trituberculatus]|uniref:Uncharacterized protein n=1 Tax=Portunus trituberculatus TaxID=210409 RepID=A0A5B7ECQ1_PORTR|nr:hypothetical protein [Portunus trituberculatus]
MCLKQASCSGKQQCDRQLCSGISEHARASNTSLSIFSVSRQYRASFPGILFSSSSRGMGDGIFHTSTSHLQPQPPLR